MSGVMRGRALALTATIAMVAVGGGALALRHQDRPSQMASDTLEVAKAPDDDESLLAWAENVLAGKCMVSAGFDFKAAAPQAREHDRVNQFDEMYGRVDTTEAKRVGFGISPELRLDEGSVEDPNLHYLKTLSDQDSARFDRAYFGSRNNAVRIDVVDGDVSVGTEGCLADARTTLYGGIAEWAPLDVWATDLNSRAYAKVVESDGYRAALSRWRHCIRGSGFTDADPAALRSRIADGAEQLGAITAERAAAVADADCNRRSGLRREAEARHRSTVEAMIILNRAKHVEWRHRRDQALRMARELAASY
ncbi:hypothetical protein ACWKSP_41225 [Micromonosporaceae bacterium Da 78-11]